MLKVLAFVVILIAFLIVAVAFLGALLSGAFFRDKKKKKR